VTQMPPQLDAFQMLKREHKIVDDLLDRLRELGERMLTGERVSPGTVRLGVGLLDAYLHRVHMRQFDFELWPDAQAVAGPECAVPLESARLNHIKIRRSTQRLLELTSRWANGDIDAQERVARELLDLAAADAAVNQFEEKYPLACLESALPSTAKARVGSQFAGHSGTKGAVEANIVRFLNATRIEE
jgi:hypothetical protein